jgi:hypothetical protein
MDLGDFGGFEMSMAWPGRRRALARGIELLAGTGLIAVGLALPLTPTRHCDSATADPALPGCPSTLNYFAYVREHFVNNSINPGDFLLPLAVPLAALLVLFVGGNVFALALRGKPRLSVLVGVQTVIGVVLLLVLCLVVSPDFILFAALPGLGFYALFAGLTLSMVASHGLAAERSVARR